MSTDPKSLAAEIERLHKAASPAPWAPQPGIERERARGRFWSRCKGFPPKPVGQMDGQETSAEREANMQLACLLRSHVPEILAALQSRAFEDGAQTPSEPSPGLLMSMAMRYDHSLGMPGCRDWKMMPGLGEREPGRHARILANTMGKMRQLWEEVTGDGFYCPAREADYVASAKSCGVTFNEIGRPMALPLQPEGERSDG